MQPHKIKALMFDQDVRQSEIAAELSVSRQAVSQVVNGHDNSRRIMEYIARRVRKTPEKLWGKRYRQAA